MKNIRKCLRENDMVYRIFAALYCTFGNNRIKGRSKNEFKLSGAKLKGVNIWCEDDSSTVIIGKDGLMMGNVQLASTEGKTIAIGDGVLFSDDICVRTGDSHSIIDADGMRLNPAADVALGNHVWVGNRVIILKGASIGDNSIVGSGSVVTKQFPECVAIAGNPAKVVRENVNWKFERI